jgi:predicted phage baseplate assembly protein
VDRHGQIVVEDIAAALGNIVLADHGATVDGAAQDELLGPVPSPALRWVTDPDGCEDPRTGDPVPVRFRPVLRLGPVTQAATRPERNGAGQPAGDAFHWQFRDVLPEVELTDTGTGQRWSPRRDLLASDQTAQEFVAEVEDDGRAFLRFGDDTFGEAPAEGTSFAPVYRVGNGVAGNIGAGTLGHLVGDARVARLAGVLVGVTNPLPARGGTEPETIEEVRSRSPFAFRVQARAVTPADYEQAARTYPSEQHPEIQQAVATFRWTGSWYTVFLTVDRLGGLEVDADFETKFRAHLERFRLAGHDIEIESPRYVPLELQLTVRVRSEYFRSDVEQALLAVLTSRTLPDGRRGPFHPDNFTFGQTVYLSPVLAAAQAVAGVVSVRATRFGRQGTQPVLPIPDRQELGRLEIARLDNNANLPDRGVLRLEMEGGK